MEPSPFALPVAAALAWVVLHVADHALTLAAFRLRAQGDLPRRIDLGGSLELNPRFRAALEQGRLLSRPFLISLTAGLVLLPGFFLLLALAATLPGASEGYRATLDALGAVLLGALVVTRVQLLGNHLQSIALFRRLLSVPEAAVVQVRYDRGTVMAVSRGRYWEAIALVGLSAAVTGSPFLWGGVAGLLGMVGAAYRWERGDRARSAAGPAAAA